MGLFCFQKKSEKAHEVSKPIGLIRLIGLISHKKNSRCARRTGRRRIISTKRGSHTVGDYFTGTSSSVFFSSFQNGSTVLMRARSVVVCGDFMVGPSETTSK